MSTGILPKYRNEFWNRTKDIEQDYDALSEVAVTAEQIVQKREIVEQSCVIAEIFESRSDDKELIEEQKEEVEAVKKDLAEQEKKITANVDAVTATQQQVSDPNRGRGRGRGGYSYSQRGRGGYNYNPRGPNQGYRNNRPNYGPQGGSYNQGRQDQGYGNFQPNLSRDNSGSRPRYPPPNQAVGNYQPPANQGSRGRGGGVAGKVWYQCQKVGHIARQCRANPANQQQKSNPHNNYPRNNNPQNNFPQNNCPQPRYPQNNAANTISQNN